MPSRGLDPASRIVSSEPDRRSALVRHVFARTAGASFTEGNSVELLLDADENYPAWRKAIEAAQHSVHLEMYIVRADPVGYSFAELLVSKVREGVRVRVLYDWWGGMGSTVRGFWRRLRAGGVEVRCVNPMRLTNALSWPNRDHRKLLVVDRRVAFVSGLCIGQDWQGMPERDIPPWRDTGVAVRGPAVDELERAFLDMWALDGEPAEPADAPPPSDRPGDRSVGIVASSPEMTRLLRLDLFWAAIARERLWLADAYFIAIPSYLGALQSAALDGVDLRLLVPSASDIQLVATFSRTQYRPLLEAGVRVFEWKGPMMHAKTAVVDGHWSRVGSSNLNLASWLGNWELDVCVDDETFGEAMEATFLQDLENSTEIVLDPRRRVHPVETAPRTRGKRRSRGSASRAATAALNLGKSFGAALAQRGVAGGEVRAFAAFGLTLLVLAFVVATWPKILSYGAATVAAYVGISLLVRALRVWRQRAARRRSSAVEQRDDAGPDPS